MKSNNLLKDNPILASEWDNDKNGDLKPEDVSPHCNQKVSWICPECKKSYDARVSNRNRPIHGSRCPYCYGTMVVEGKNDLASQRPDVAKEWHRTKNKGLTPNKVRVKSGKKVYWLCPKDHEYEAVVGQRTRPDRPTGCPICSGNEVLPGINDLASQRPDLAKEWDLEKNGDLKPQDVTVWSNKLAWWRCLRCNHSWRTPIESRSNGSGCPKCNKQHQLSIEEKAICYYLSKAFFIEENNREVIKPKEIDCYIPILNIGIEYDGPYHSREDTYERDIEKINACQSAGIILIKLRQSDLPPIEGCYSIPVEKNSKSSLTDAIINAIRIISDTKGVTIQLDVNVERDYLAICKKKYSTIVKNSLAEKFPKIAEEWNKEKNNGLDPNYLPYGSVIDAEWVCAKGHGWSAPINRRTNRYHKSGCPYCSGNKVFPGFNDLASQRPDVAAEWHPTLNGSKKPSDVTKSSSEKVWWLCPKNHHSYQAVICERTRTDKPSGCPFCSGRIVLEGFNDLASQRPDVAAEWHPTLNGNLKSTDVTKSSNRKVWWMCKKGHEWEARIDSRTRFKRPGCPQCFPKKR